jgi:plasmid stabilization system protein ParE
MAESQIDAALMWWPGHRPAAPTLLSSELAQAIQQVASVPHMGRRVRLRGTLGARRLLLRRTQYHLYCVVFEAERQIPIVYFRHARRRLSS